MMRPAMSQSMMQQSTTVRSTAMRPAIMHTAAPGRRVVKPLPAAASEVLSTAIPVQPAKMHCYQVSVGRASPSSHWKQMRIATFDRSISRSIPFLLQCEQTNDHVGCTVIGNCGKTPEGEL